MTARERVQNFVRDAASNLSEAPRDPGLEYTRLERGPDGYFRERKKRIWPSWTLTDDWFHSIPDYQTCVECLKSDLVIGPHIDSLVGTSDSFFRREANYILKSLIDVMFDDEGSVGNFV